MNYDVIAVNFNVEPKRVRVIAANKDEHNAEAIVNMAVMRRGVDEEFFSTVPAGKFKDGDEYLEEG